MEFQQTKPPSLIAFLRTTVSVRSIMARKSAYLEHLARVPLFSDCSKSELERLARRTTDITIQPGQAILKEGRTGFEFFVIVGGTAEVTRRGKRIAELGPGDFFGELALLDNAPRDATVTALTPMEVIVLTRAEFNAALAEAPRMTRKLMTGMARRLRQLDELV
jgi:CRP/FNR family transcriptional regulator, cyclic AMP receptor protein